VKNIIRPNLRSRSKTLKYLKSILRSLERATNVGIIKRSKKMKEYLDFLIKSKDKEQEDRRHKMPTYWWFFPCHRNMHRKEGRTVS